MLVESVAGRTQQGSARQAFWWRLSDNLFRRFVLFLIPVLAMTSLGVVQARNTSALYRSTGTLSASTNPLVPQQQISGASSQYWETPAQSTSRIINEQLQTNSFLNAVVEKSGLTAAVDSGLVDLATVRSSLWASASGDSILSVNAQWENPQTSYALAKATIDQYETFLAERVASDSKEAEDFYTAQLEVLKQERQTAQDALSKYVASLPTLATGETYPVNVQLELDRLSAAVTSAESKITTTEQNIDDARLARTQQTTEAGRSFTVIDEPRVPSTPESTLMKKVTLVASFFLLGIVIAAAALLVTTALGRTVTSPNDLLGIGGVALVATVPPVRFPVEKRSSSRRRSRGARRTAEAAR